MTDLTTQDSTPVSRLTFGTMQFGGKTGAAKSAAIYDAARAAGITRFDTAVRYTDGAGESILGQLIKDERPAIYLATKVGYTGRSGRANILAQFDICRIRPQQDQVDLLYMHQFDNATPLEETFSTMAQLQSSGAIRHIGVSNYAAWQVMKAQAVARDLGTRIDVMQPMCSLVERQSEVEIFGMCADQRIALVPYLPLGGGLLTEKYVQGGTGWLTDYPRYKLRYGQEWMHATAASLTALARDLGTDPATLAVAWVMAHLARPSPIISSKSLDQSQPSLAAADFTRSQALYNQITALSPAPPPATDRLEEA